MAFSMRELHLRGWNARSECEVLDDAVGLLLTDIHIHMGYSMPNELNSLKVAPTVN